MPKSDGTQLSRQYPCELCSGEHFIIVGRRVFPGQRRLLRCRGCGLVVLRDGENVGHDYWAEDSSGLDVYGDAIYLAEVEQRYQRYLDFLTRLCGRPGVLLDAGCGPGNFLRAARAAQWEAHGVDPSFKAVARARHFGFDVDAVRIEDIQGRVGTYDAITVLDVLEHVLSPRRFLEVIHRMLRPGGVVLLETPDEGFWMRRVVLGSHILSGGFLDMLMYFYYEDHRFYFTAQTLTTLLTQVGLHVTHISREATPVSKARLKINPWAFPMKRIVLGVLPSMLGIMARLGGGNKLIVSARKPLAAHLESQEMSPALKPPLSERIALQ